MTDYLTQARHYLDVDQFGQEPEPEYVKRAMAYTLVDIADSLRKLSEHMQPLQAPAQECERCYGPPLCTCDTTGQGFCVIHAHRPTGAPA
jgi:hypothetical protein